MVKITTRIKRFFKILGPGVITGAADDDPSGIATYSQTGAQFGYGQLWTAVFMLPLMTAVQGACARLGAVTGQGLAAIIKSHYSRATLYFAVGLIVVANTINIGADIGAMTAAAQLIVPVNFSILILFFTALILITQIFLPYRPYARILKWLALSLTAYLITVFIVKQPWLTILKATFIPHLEFNFDYLFIITGVLGTTISPYLFFWQASEEVEEEKSHHLFHRHQLRPAITGNFIKRIKWDNFIGMFFSELATWCIIVVAATVLHSHGLTNIGSAADAAKALEPLVQTFPYAGFLAKIIFAVGIIGLGLLAVPVLSGSAAYAVCETFNFKEGLNLKLKRAHGFYGVIIVATLVGLTINFLGIDPMKALIYAAVFNALAAVPLLFIIARLARDEKIMGKYRSGLLSNTLIWLTFGLMAASALALLWTIWHH